MQTVKDFQIPFVGLPKSSYARVSIGTSGSNAGRDLFLEGEGAISVVTDPSHSHVQAEFFSTLFLVPQKNGSMSLVINLKALNR